MQNFFDQFDTPAPTPAPAATTPGIIRGRPDPYKASNDIRANNADIRDERRLSILEQEAADRKAKEAKEAQEKADETTRSQAALLSRLKSDAKNIARLGRDANDNGGFGETGTSGSLSRNWLPAGTAGYSLGADIETFKAKNAFAGLSELAAQGIKLTPVSNEEIKLAAASIANHDPNADHATFKRAVEETKQYYYDAIARIDPLEAYDTAFRNRESLDAILAIAERNGGPIPDRDKLAEAIAIRDRGETDNAVFKQPEPPEGGPPSGGGYTLEEAGRDFYAGVGDVAQGVGDAVGLVANPLNAGINALTGSNLSTDLGQTFRDATGAPEGRSPLASAINRGGASVLTTAGISGLARPVAQSAGQFVADAFAQQPVRRAVAEGANTVARTLSQEPIRQAVGGASAGAAAELARQAGANPLLQVAAGLAGGVGGYGAAGIPQAIMQPRQANPLLQAAQRQGVEIMPADAGGVTTQRLTSAAAQAPVSSPPIVAAAERANATFGQATQRATGGSRLAPDDAGAIVRSAGDRFTKESRAKGGALYNRAENMAKGVRIKARGAIQTIDEQIAQLREGGEVNAPLIGELTKFRNSLANNEGIRIGGMRDIRTGAQKAAYSDDLRATPAQRVFGIVADAISQDIDAGLAQAGRSNAAQAFKTADAYWRDRVQYIDNVLEPIIGNGKSGEAVLRSVEDMAKGKGKGVQTLMKLMRSVDKEELSDIQATIIDRLGRASSGQQNAEGNVYSAAQFLTRWNDMSAKGKAALFPDQNVRRNLDELAIIAENMKQSARFANTSNTAGGIIGQTIITGGVAAGGILPFILGTGAQYLSGRVLASPGLTRWLAAMPKNPQAQAAHIKRLDSIAAAEPIIANDIASIKQFLANAPTSARAAAAEGDDVGEERPIKP